MSRAALGRMEREALQARERKRCAAEGRHPPGRTFWTIGDAMTPDKLVCRRCYAVLAQRRHEAGGTGTPSR
jgi:hypothetical protein